MTPPKITIITACKNVLGDLQKTVDSVQKQTFSRIEHIIIDAASDDGTPEWLAGLENSKLRFLSEPDRGISDAFNKGIRLATGDYLFFLGAGDLFTDKDVLQKIFADLKTQPWLICGKILRVSEKGEPLWQAPTAWPSRFSKTALIKKLTLPHQGLFMHKRFFEQYGDFALNCRFAMDYELLLRAYHNFPSIVLVNEVVATWQEGGIGAHRTLEIYDEYHRIKKKHNIAPFWQLVLVDRWNRLKYHIKSLLA